MRRGSSPCPCARSTPGSLSGGRGPGLRSPAPQGIPASTPGRTRRKRAATVPRGARTAAGDECGEGGQNGVLSETSLVSGRDSVNGLTAPLARPRSRCKLLDARGIPRRESRVFVQSFKEGARLVASSFSTVAPVTYGQESKIMSEQLQKAHRNAKDRTPEREESERQRRALLTGTRISRTNALRGDRRSSGGEA